jgi:hypothetical protein
MDYKPSTSVAMKVNGNQEDILPVTKDDTKGKMLNMLRHLYKNIFALANALQDSRPDLAQKLDSIIEGHKWDTKGLNERYSHIIVDSILIQYDKQSNTFATLDINTKETSEIMNALTTDDVKLLLATPE